MWRDRLAEDFARDKPDDYPVPHCPICNTPCSSIYTIKGTGEPIGCDQCITERDAWEVMADGA